jgi:hypothetical protein
LRGTLNLNSRSIANQLLMLCLLCSSLAQAQTGMGFGGEDNFSDWQAAILFGFFAIYALLVLIGFLSSIGAFLANTKLESERIRALRWIGLNWLEPTLTILAVVVLVVIGESLKQSALFSPVWFLLPVSTFCFSLFPPVFFSSQNPLVQTTWRTLRLVALLRVLSVGALLLVLTFVRSFVIAVIVDGVGLAVLAWSFWRLGQLAILLNTQELQPPGQRILE